MAQIENTNTDVVYILALKNSLPAAAPHAQAAP